METPILIPMKSYTNVNETVTVRKPYLGPINMFYQGQISPLHFGVKECGGFQGGENNQIKLGDVPELNNILSRILMCGGVRND